ncbi:TIGR03943 family putative permease subunit [Blastococcus haudaquaticus]|uniref:TIGR03943 family protein n=1 Tax=Blastococcus haudaquaticus TaxID=1938745 RepID=A0A286H4I0_9ACTN|nr:TIGR03943 family protein [Blastococcus haudaquaticus]SOE02239.1 TIGR03943 family protein [Blastococcus haudaquaticus]
MERLVTHLLLVLLGGTVLHVSLTDAYLAYVQPGFRPLLVLAGAALLLSGTVGFVLDRPRVSPVGRHASQARDHDHDHQHGHVPWVSWLLVLPVAVLLMVAPPALGVFTVERQSQPLAAATPDQVPEAVPAEELQLVRSMSMLEYGQWALADDPGPLTTSTVRLQGFVVPRGDDGWYLSRIRINCCAADAVPVSVVVDGNRQGVAPGEWVEVVGTWSPPAAHPSDGYPEPVIEARSVTPIPAPVNPYES